MFLKEFEQYHEPWIKESNLGIENYDLFDLFCLKQ